MNSVSAWIERVERVEEQAGVLGLWKRGVTGVEWLQKVNAAIADKRIALAQSMPMRTR